MTLVLLLSFSLAWGAREMGAGQDQHTVADGGASKATADAKAAEVKATEAFNAAKAADLKATNAATAAEAADGKAGTSTILAIGSICASALAFMVAIGVGFHSWRVLKELRALERKGRSELDARAEPPDSEDGRVSDRSRPPGRSRDTQGAVGEARERGARSHPAAPKGPPGEIEERVDASIAARQDPRDYQGVQPTRRPDPAGLARATAAPLTTPTQPAPDPIPPRAANNEPTEAEVWLRAVSAGPHGTIAAALGRLYLDSGSLARALQDPANQEEFTRVARTGLKSRLERFKKIQRGPATDFYSEWVEPDLIPILDGLSNLYSRALAEARLGNIAAAPVAAQIHEALYERIGPSCEEAGWFAIQVIVPFETDFDPIRHAAIGTADARDASQKVVDIKQAGRMEVGSHTVVAAAHVVVGR